jgi:drug/metabolite transporter (DMT)-like permease
LLAIPGVFGLAQTGAAEEAVSRYIERDIDAAGAAFRLGILTLSGLFFLFVLAPPWRRQFPGDYKLAVIGAWMMVGFFGLFFVSTVIGDRFGYYLIPVQLIIFARIPYLKTLRNRQMWAIAPYAGLSLVFVVWTQLSWHFNQCYIPYDIRFGAPTPLPF